MRLVNIFRCCWMLVTFIPGILLAQQQNLELKDLNVPSSPAFTILDYAPATIDRPGNAKTFSASLTSLLTNGNGLPKNFAIEITPFWFFKNNLDAWHYLGINVDGHRNVFSNIRNVSFSFGSVNRDSTKNELYNANYISAGVRLNPIRITNNRITKSLSATITNLTLRQTTIANDVAAACTALTNESSERLNCLAKSLEKVLKADLAYNELEQKLKNILAIKPVFSLDIAGASSWAFKDNVYASGHHYRTGAWTTAAFNFPLCGTSNIDHLIENKNYLSLYATLRYIAQDSSTDFKTFTKQNLLDIGGRIELALNRFTIAFESIHRFNQDIPSFNTHRNAGIVEYKVTDNLFLSAAYGKNFGAINNLITLFSLNWGFGAQSVRL